MKYQVGLKVTRPARADVKRKSLFSQKLIHKLISSSSSSSSSFFLSLFLSFFLSLEHQIRGLYQFAHFSRLSGTLLRARGAFDAHTESIDWIKTYNSYKMTQRQLVFNRWLPEIWISEWQCMSAFVRRIVIVYCLACAVDRWNRCSIGPDHCYDQVNIPSQITVKNGNRNSFQSSQKSINFFQPVHFRPSISKTEWATSGIYYDDSSSIFDSIQFEGFQPDLIANSIMCRRKRMEIYLSSCPSSRRPACNRRTLLIIIDSRHLYQHNCIIKDLLIIAAIPAVAPIATAMFKCHDSSLIHALESLPSYGGLLSIPPSLVPPSWQLILRFFWTRRYL